MKKSLIVGAFALSAILLLNGCLALDIGGGSKTQTQKATVGQQLCDLQKAKDAGAITETEFQQQKEKLLANH